MRETRFKSPVPKEPLENRSLLPIVPEDEELRFIKDEGQVLIFDSVSHRWIEILDRYSILLNDLMIFGDDEFELLIEEARARRKQERGQ